MMVPEACRRKLARQRLLLYTATIIERFGVNDSLLPANKAANVQMQYVEGKAEELNIYISRSPPTVLRV